MQRKVRADKVTLARVEMSVPQTILDEKGKPVLDEDGNPKMSESKPVAVVKEVLIRGTWQEADTKRVIAKRYPASQIMDIKSFDLMYKVDERAFYGIARLDSVADTNGAKVDEFDCPDEVIDIQ